MATLLCPFSITTWWWLLRQLHQRQRTMTCFSTVSCPTAPLRCCGSSRAPQGAARWQPPTEAATVEAPAVWCLPAACETATKTERETGTGTAIPSQDCQGHRWKLQRRRQPSMAQYLTLSLLTRPPQNWKTREKSRTEILCKYRGRWKNTVLCTERKIYFQFYLSYVYKLRTLPVRWVTSVDIFLWILKTFSHLFMWSFDYIVPFVLSFYSFVSIFHVDGIISW